MQSTSGNSSTFEYFIPLRNLLHLSQLNTFKVKSVLRNLKFASITNLYMLSPFSSSALKKAARQSCKPTVGPQNQLRSHSHIHPTQPGSPPYASEHAAKLPPAFWVPWCSICRWSRLGMGSDKSWNVSTREETLRGKMNASPEVS